jgi:hypothetical protein
MSKTRGAVRVSEKVISRIHAVGLAIRALGDPSFVQGRSGLVSKSVADATDGKQRFSAERRELYEGSERTEFQPT